MTDFMEQSRSEAKSQQSRNSPPFMQPVTFITVFMRSRHWSLSWSGLIQLSYIVTKNAGRL